MNEMKSSLIKIIFMLGALFLALSSHAEDASSWDDWKMRTELVLDTENGKKPLYFIETVQPLYRASDRQNTFLMQFRLAEDDRFTERRNIFNLGVGYRKLLADNEAMAGLKMFYDAEGKYNMNRWSMGADVSWKALDLYANKYYGLTDWTSTNEGATEKSANGYDVDIAAQLPYMPWAKAHVMYYQWDRERTLENVIGRKYSLEGALSLRWSVELGRNVDNIVANDNFMMLRYRWAGFIREHQNANTNFWASSAFEMRDMKDYTLERMRRSNTVTVERIEP
jgi:hypothetical protein